MKYRGKDMKRADKPDLSEYRSIGAHQTISHPVKLGGRYE
jgi:hypothetical protein